MIGKLLLSIIVSVYYYYLVFAANFDCLTRGLRQGVDPLYFVDILIHEAGHFLAMPIYALGNYELSSPAGLFYFFGGSLLQWLMPLIFVIYFAYKKQPFAAFTVLFWFGQSIYDSVPYIGDAVYMSMPLLSSNAIHDWNFIFNQLGWLPYTKTIATGTLYTAVTILTISLAGMWWTTVSSLRAKLNSNLRSF